MNTQQVHRLLYALKRQWGASFDYVQILTSEVDNRTGTRRIQREAFKVPAVILPQNQIRKFIQDIGYLAANKNFTYGGLNDFNTITLIIDKQDLPQGLKFDLNGYVDFQGKRFEKVSFTDLINTAYILIARGVEGANSYSTVIESAHNTLQMQGQVIYELN